MKKTLSILLSILMAFSAFSAMPFSAFADTYKGIELDEAKFYFDTSTTGWTLGTTDKIAFYITSDKYGEELPYGAKKLCGTLCEFGSEKGVWEYDPAAKGITIEDGVQYKIQFYNTGDPEPTYPLYFDSNCLGHVAVCDGTEYDNPTDSSAFMLAAFWNDLDSSVYGPILAITSLGNVVGTCVKDNETKLDMFENFISVAGDTGATGLENARVYVVELGTKTEQQLIDDLGTDLGLTKQDVYDAFNENSVETTWDYTISTLPGDVEIALKCGDNVYYYYTDNGATLNLIGTGDTWDYDYFSDKSPFSDNADIKSITVEDGITGIGDSIFMECINLESVSLPASIKTIGDSAFADCIYYGPVLPEGLVTIGENAFCVCAQNTDPSIYSVIFIPSTVTSIGNEAFSDFNNVSIVVVPENASYSNDTFSSVSSEGFDIWKYSVCAEQTGAPEGTKFIDIKSREGNRQETTLPCGFTYNSKYIIKSVAVDGVTLSHNYNSNNECTVCGKVKEVTSVRNYADLKELARQVNADNDYAGKTVVLENDIVCKNNENDTDYATDWVPIGNESTPFKGTFDGKGYTITGLSTAENITASYVGLFGYVDGGTVKNVGLEGGAIKGKHYVGGIAGYLVGTVTNCYNTSEVSGTDKVGGIVGLAGGTVTNCYNAGAVVDANGDAGGICGSLTSQAVVQRCYNTGAVRGPLHVGGVVGYMLHGGRNTVQDCYNTGAVTGITVNNSSPKVGGIVGIVGGTVVKNCYNTGEVSGPGEYVGGVAGDNSKNRLQNCYYDKTICSAASVSGNTADTDNVKGLTTAQMTGTNALDNMVFTYGDGEGNPWLVKPDGDGYWYYPHLKGFDFGGDEGDGTQEVGGVVGYDTGGSVGNNYNTGSVNTQLTADKIDAENWPAKAEVSITWNGDSTYTYDGTTKRIVPTSVKVGGIALTESVGYDVKYMKKDNYGSWVETNNTINAGEYRTVIFFLRAVVDDEVIKYIADDSHSEITKDFEIEPKSLTNASITLSAASATYNGNNIAQPFVESVNDDQNASVPASAYNVSYTEGDWKNAGTYKVTVTGKGNYKDSAEATFEIKKKTLTVTAKDRTCTYNGTAQGENNKTYTTELDSKVTVSGLQGSDKLTSITLNGQETNAGTYNDRIVASAAAIGNATANYDITYIAGKLTIDPKPITITVNGNSKEVTYNGGEQTFNGTFTPTSSDIMFDASKFVYSGSTSVSGTNVNTYTLSPVIANAAYADNNFTASFVAGNPVKLTINKATANVTVVGNNNTSEYDEKEHVVTDYVAMSDNDLYDVTKFFTFSGIAEAKRTEVGTTVMGLDINRFTNINNNFNVTFNVTDGYQKIEAQPMDENALDVTLDDITYDGTAKEPIVKAGETVLEKDKDYTISYTDSDGNAVSEIKGAGEYTVTITGKGNYSGEVTKPLTVAPAEITVTAEDKTSVEGEALAELTYKVKGKVADGDDLGIKLSTTANKDKAGEYTITATVANANYKATIVEGKYTVTAKPEEPKKEEPAKAEKDNSKEELNAGIKGTSDEKGVTIYWGKAKKATKYVIYATYCGKNDLGRYKKIATVSGDVTKYEITELKGKKLNQKKNVKAYVVAYKGKKKLAKSVKIHVAGYQTEFTNAKKIKAKKKLTVKKGKTKKIKAKVIFEDSGKKPVDHVRKLRYRSGNKKIATVSKSGKIKAKKKGKVTIYIFANNGMTKKVKVTVK